MKSWKLSSKNCWTNRWMIVANLRLLCKTECCVFCWCILFKRLTRHVAQCTVACLYCTINHGTRCFSYDSVEINTHKKLRYCRETRATLCISWNIGLQMQTDCVSAWGAVSTFNNYHILFHYLHSYVHAALQCHGCRQQIAIQATLWKCQLNHNCDHQISSTTRVHWCTPKKLFVPVTVFHLALTALLHYRAKFENSK